MIYFLIVVLIILLIGVTCQLRGIVIELRYANILAEKKINKHE